MSAIKEHVLADFLLKFPLEQESDALAIISTLLTHENTEPTTPALWWTLIVDGVVNKEGP